MSSSWTITPAYQAEGFATNFPSLDVVMKLKGERIGQDPRCRVFRLQYGERVFYLKKFRSNGKLWRHRYSPSRVKTEWTNLQRFASWDIPTPPLVAYGHERRFGQFVRGAIITEAAYGAQSLEDLAYAHSPVVTDYRLFRQLARKVADYTRRLHDRKFAHNDLDWRNILVTTEPEPQPYFFDSPMGRFWFGPFLRYRIFKDLAHLDEVARDVIPPKWRLYFYHCYTGRKTLTRADKERIRAIIRYYDNR